MLEDERNKEPRTIVDACSRWNSWETSNDDRRADVADPWLGITSLPEVKWYWDKDSGYNGIEMGMVDGTCAELTQWANETPTNDG